MLRVYYPTTHHFLSTLGRIAHTFDEYKRLTNFGDIMSFMMVKFKKYYDDLPLLYYVALYLDSQMKIIGFENINDYLFQTLVKDCIN